MSSFYFLKLLHNKLYNDRVKGRGPMLRPLNHFVDANKMVSFIQRPTRGRVRFQRIVRQTDSHESMVCVSASSRQSVALQPPADIGLMLLHLVAFLIVH